MRIRFVSLAPTREPALSPLVEEPAARALAPGAWVQVEHELSGPSGAATHLITYVGAPVVDETLGAIQIDQPLAPLATYIMRGVVSVLASTVAMLLVCGVIVALIGAKVVGQPVSELIAAARRIGEGHFEVVGPVDRADEFGELARAMRSMSGDLASARERTAAEADARIRALEQLRHAERLATLGQLASVLAHEIGTPLNVIAGHSKMIATGRLQGAGAQESASAIGEQCGRMTGIVRRILDYARRRPPRRAKIDAAVVMRQACELLSGLAAQRGVELALGPAEGDMQLFADPDQLQQAITNLVLNAIQASAPGQRITLRAQTGADGADVVFTVEDRGQGIGEEARERIFEPFFTTKPPGEGTGLGLSVVRDIVQEHGGVVEVSSIPGTGSTFSLHLPKEQAHASASADR
jgi:signal transduction histidine kinase